MNADFHTDSACLAEQGLTDSLDLKCGKVVRKQSKEQALLRNIQK